MRQVSKHALDMHSLELMFLKNRCSSNGHNKSLKDGNAPNILARVILAVVIFPQSYQIFYIHGGLLKYFQLILNVLKVELKPYRQLTAKHYSKVLKDRLNLQRSDCCANALIQNGRCVMSELIMPKFIQAGLKNSAINRLSSRSYSVFESNK